MWFLERYKASTFAGLYFTCVGRHWKELMEKTGQVFEMNPETFTLQNVFAMELHRFQNTIAEIVNCAVKELAIEKVIRFIH